MGKRKRRGSMFGDLVEFFNHTLEEKPLLPFLVPVMLFFWTIERWFFSLSNWVPLVLAVWTTLQYGSYQRRILAEDLDREWKQIILRTTPETPLEHCEWLNKLFMEVWPNYFSQKFSIRFSSIVGKRLRHLKSRLIDKVELLEFSLGSYPPCLGLQGTRWSTSGDQKIMRLGLDWDTNDMSILLLAKLAKPLIGTARIVINSLHIKGDLLLMPVLHGRAILYSFVAAPEVRIGVAFGSGGSQSLPATELPGVSSWLVKLFTDNLTRTMVEPRRRCFSLPAVDLRKKAVGCSIYVTVISGSKLSRNSLRGSPSKRQQQSNFCNDPLEEGPLLDEREIRTFVEVEVEELTRRTHIKAGSSPKWDSTFNMVLHEDTGSLRFHLFEATPNSVKYDYLTSCEIKVKYAADDSTTYWAIGPDSGVIAKHAQFCGREVEMVVPFEGVNSGKLTVRLVIKEWQFSDGSHSAHRSQIGSRGSLNGSSNFMTRTGRKINVTVVEGKDFMVKEKCTSYVKLQYGKALHKTRTAYASTPNWNQRFEFEEVGDGEYLKIKCYAEETFGDENIGSARVNLEGLVDGLVRDVWIPLEKASSGELRLQIEAVRDDSDGSRGSRNGADYGWVELAVIEAKDLVAADIRGTSDPYVRIQYGNMKRKTKILYKTLTPRWDQTFEIPDDGSPLVLHVKDHNNLLPTSNIGDCVVEYQRLPPNQMFDKWIPLQGVKRGEIHIQITRKVPELQKSFDSETSSSLSKAQQTSSQMKKMMLKTQSLVEDGDYDGLATALSELESLEDMQEDYMVQLETEQTLLLNKIKELGEEMFNPPPPAKGRKPSEN